jgi:hypothetical protein
LLKVLTWRWWRDGLARQAPSQKPDGEPKGLERALAQLLLRRSLM